MRHETITIISEIDGDVQAWTFAIEESDLYNIAEKYGAQGVSVRTTPDNIGTMIDNIYG